MSYHRAAELQCRTTVLRAKSVFVLMELGKHEQQLHHLAGGAGVG